MPRVILTGPHSCGKTTLANELMRRWKYVFGGEKQPTLLTEVARGVMQSNGFSRDDIAKVAFQSAIIEAQLRAENTVKDTVSAIYDRCLLDPIAYTHLNNQGGEYRELLMRNDVQTNLDGYRSHTLVVLLEPVEQFAYDDGTRSLTGSMEEWMECLSSFERILEEAGIQYVRLGASVLSLGDRVEQTKMWLEAMGPRISSTPSDK